MSSPREAILRVFLHLWWVLPLAGGAWIAVTARGHGLLFWETYTILGVLLALTAAVGGLLHIQKVLKGDVHGA